jgi:hypothetical protein
MVCTICFGLGFYIGKRFKHQTQPRAAPVPTEEQKRNAEKQKIETNNMLTYNGDEQPDID